MSPTDKRVSLIAALVVVATFALVLALVTMFRTGPAIIVFAAGGGGLLALLGALLRLAKLGSELGAEPAADVPEPPAQTSDSFLDRLLASMNEAVFLVGEDARIRHANDAAVELCARDRDLLIGKPIASVLIDSDRPAGAVGEARPREAEIRRGDGRTVCVSYTRSDLTDQDGQFESSIYSAQNIDERKRAEQRMRYLARTDPLTKIANRMEFQHRLQQKIARAKRGNQYLALLYLDVDRFKDINDTFGHSAGDRSLEMFARRIGDALPEDSISGRLAGDEFSVLLPHRSSMEALVQEAGTVAERLLRAVGKPFDVKGDEIFMSTSIGVALYPRDADNVVDLVRNADAAMYYAKRAGGNNYDFYEQHMNSAAEERLKLKSRLSRAFERNELRLHYQPKYRVSDGKVAGAEALVRWDLPDHGLVYPSDFIPLAEESNLIVQIGQWVLDQVCSDYRQWQRRIPSPSRISVNLSLRQLQQRRFLDGVRKSLQRHGVSPACLELEITETTLMDDARAAIRILDALYGMGLHLAIDDFGTGYSSLSALQQFPISTLKIDKSFVSDVATDEDDAAIVRTIIQMAHSLKLEVIAEGVEHEAQLDFLRSHGCDYVQGHLFGDPVTASDYLKIMVEDTEGTGNYRTLFG